MISSFCPIDDQAQLKDVRLRMLLAHWKAAAKDGRLPTRDIIDPLVLGDLMGWLFLYEVEREPMRFRYLIYGPKIARRGGFDLTGQYVDDHPLPEARVAINRLLAAVATTGRPHRGLSRRRLLDHDVVTEAVVVPLAGSDGTIAHLLALQILDPPGSASAPQPPPASPSPTGNWIAQSTRTPIEDGAQIKDIRVRLLYSHWNAGIRGGRFPSKDIIDPARFGDLMGWLFLYRVERDPLRFLYLLYGPKIALRFNRDLTGRYVDEYPDPDTGRAITAVLTAVVDSGRPYHVVSPRRLLDREMTTEAIVLPLAGADGTIDHLLALQILDVPGDGDA